MIGFLKRLRYRRQYSDIVPILLLLGLSSYLMRPLFDWNTKVLTSDLSGSWAWFYWLKESLFGFHQFPTWSPLWMGGMPFFGMVPSAGYFLVFPFYLITGDIPAAYNLATIIMFSLAGISMYLYLKHLSQNSLASFSGAVIYIILPVHISAMMFWGHYDISATYALAPLVLLFTDRFLDGKKQINIILLGLFVSFVLLFQIEYALIFLFFYVSYLVFALAIRRIGIHSMSGLLRKNKVGIVICLLILLIPLSFYLTVLAEYSDFSGLTPDQIEGGLSVYALKHFSDPFQDKLGGGLDGYFNMPAADYYCGVLSFVILLASMCFVFLEKDKRRAQLLFFLILGIAFLILSMGVYGPLFTALRRIIPLLSGMRAPLRFYYIFALCLPVLFTLSFLSFAKLVAKAPRVPVGMRQLLKNGAPVLLIVALMLDFSPYFDFYHHRVMDKEAYNRVYSFLEERIKEDDLPADNIARVLIAPDGTILDRVSKFEQAKQGQFTIEIAQSWVPWNQYKEAVDYYSVFESITETADHLAFYSNLLSIDYILVYRNKVPPIQEEEYVSQKLTLLNSYCGGAADLLRYRGSLDTDYYTIYLYEVRDVPSKVKFHPMDTSLMVASDDTFISTQLLHSYSEVSGSISASAFVNKIVAVSSNIQDVVGQSIRLVSLDDLPALLVQQTETPSYDSVQIGDISLTAKGLSFEVNVNEKGILSLTYYYNPWWKAYVDGEESPVLRVNGIFAGTYVNEGQHHVEFVYDYPSLPNVISRLWR